MEFDVFKEISKVTSKEQLRFNKKKGSASGTMNVLRFKDKDTKQFVIYVPSFDISGYGETIQKASEMLRFSLSEFFKFLVEMPDDKIKTELAKYGWKTTVFHKEFSKIYADGGCEIKAFNAEDNKVERLTLQAA